MDLIEKAFLAGLGALNLSKERVTELVEELVAKGEVQKKESAKVIDGLVKKAEVVSRDVKKTLEKQMGAAYGKLNLATQDQLKSLEKAIRNLQVSLAKAQPARRKRTAKSTSKK